ncbi:hypothetical protein [Methylocapsa palsarum]|uniref:DUF2158 domain-containing protein n=1 Tax=Methylocapsa palsarum TaxID=1612308 RepID=A0A1I3W8C9_9HYPH|nr:hypothetical protein [Methylocapsa palsarum]SFK03924.1 hypothetical protein SAMN05444581_101431 [Methylocapsa palsarum]
MSDANKGPVTFDPGDVVQLKSMSPPMTVVAVEADGVHVLWYGEANDEIVSDVLPGVALEKITILDDEDEEDDDDEDDIRRHGKKKRRDD